MPDTITRFAPSPTGHLHIGGARTALFCWAFSRKHHGHFILRIEDTDQARSSEASARGIMEDLAWLGILWDEGPEFTAVNNHGKSSRVGGNPRNVEGTFFQAQRLHIYNRFILKLVGEGKAYPAFESAEELDAKRKAALARKETYRYDRAALAIPLEERLDRMKEADAKGVPYVIRFRAPDEAIHVDDEVLGEVKYAAGELEDFVIRKADGFPLYNFAVVIDDYTMGVTHVLRAQEHLNNTPRQVALQKALGFPHPKYAHMPLIQNMDGSKMSKRDKAKAARKAVKDFLAGQGQGAFKSLTRSGKKDADVAVVLAALHEVDEGLTGKQLGDFIEGESDDITVAERIARRFGLALPEIEVHDFRKAGYLPEVICNFVALLGWSPGENVEKFSMDFLASRFDLERIGKTNAKFDRVKLLAFNGDAMAAMSADVFQERLRVWAAEFEPALVERFSGERWALFAETVKARCKVFGDAAKQAAFALVADDGYTFDPAAVKKSLQGGTPTGLSLLQGILADVRAAQQFDPVSVQALLDHFAAMQGVQVGSVAQPLRVALTGGGVSPPINLVMALLGRDAVVRRIERCINSCS
ncbi:MAG TPA: glutamate--tRNA ligase [Phycisphaerales bacterium]|nr:glutamate--tRNA ligase [Phycisphaerales bacterium]